MRLESSGKDVDCVLGALWVLASGFGANYRILLPEIAED
jgi:hypothetical protein